MQIQSRPLLEEEEVALSLMMLLVGVEVLLVLLLLKVRKDLEDRLWDVVLGVRLLEEYLGIVQATEHRLQDRTGQRPG